MKKISKQADDFPLCQLSASDKEKYGSIAMNRIQIIKNIQCEYVVTVCGAFEAIVGMGPSKCIKHVMKASL